ncbi:acylphosphatase [Geomicrobium sp. JCM 19055]|uniref:acylphosphatase n=1 Tax=Geomicrobium sp. JCM 19055 TaxID=1460649 RepID=UPI0022365F95|nr:acylphosphatase [Geomicrobium sp. JCM 19055]
MRYHIVVHGAVQGVGFRQFTLQTAKKTPSERLGSKPFRWCCRNERTRRSFKYGFLS